VKHEKKLKEYKAVWICDFCGEEFKTKKESDKHELICKKNKNREILLRIKLPDKETVFVLVFIFLGIYLFTFAIANSYAKTNGLGKKYLNNPLNWFSEETKNEATPTPTPTPEATPTPSPKPKIQTNNTNTNQGGQIECIGPDGKHFNTTMDECKKLADKWGKPVDYMVNCIIPSECGGGSKRVPNSECEKPCTRINNNSNNSSSNSGNRVQFTSTQGIVDGTYYCYENRVNELTRYEQLIAMKEDSARMCTDSYKPTLNSCVSACNSSPDFSNCIKPCYDNASNACISKYEETGNLRKEYMKKIYEICP